MSDIAMLSTERDNKLGSITERPFQTALSLFAVYSGVSGLLNFGASSQIFVAAVRFSPIFNWLFILAGLGVLLGMVLRKMNVEAASLLLVSVSLFMRMVATLAIAGWDPAAHNLLAISVLFITASIVRINEIAKVTRKINGGMIVK